MKKTVSIIITATIAAAVSAASVLALVGCGSKDAAKPETTTQPTTAIAAAAATTPAKTAAQAITEQATTQAQQSNEADESAVQAEGSDVQTEDSKVDSVEANPVYQQIISVLENSGATGYAFCSAEGSDYDQLILSYNPGSMGAYYEMYSLGENGLVNAGTFGNQHSVIYIDSDSARVGVYDGIGSGYAYGPVEIVNGMASVDLNTKGTLEEGQETAMPGNALPFCNIDNTYVAYQHFAL